MQGRPLSPSEIKKTHKESIPNYVWDAFNELLSERTGASNYCYIKQDEAINRIMSKAPEGVTRQMLFDKGWLDIEDGYRQQGWKVEYDKPGYCETYDANWKFSSK